MPARAATLRRPQLVSRERQTCFDATPCFSHESDKIRFLSNSPEQFVLADAVDRILDAADMTQNISYYWKAKQWQIKGKIIISLQTKFSQPV